MTNSPMENTLQQRWGPLIFSMLFFAVAFTMGLVLHSPTWDCESIGIIFMKFGEIFGILGAMYGAIYAFDVRVQRNIIDQPMLRTVVCAGLGAILVFSLQISSPLPRMVEAVAVGAGVAGCLGWAGWRWAKHVPF